MPTKVLEYCFYPVRSLEKPDRPDLPGILLLQVRSLTGLICLEYCFYRCAV